MNRWMQYRCWRSISGLAMGVRSDIVFMESGLRHAILNDWQSWDDSSHEMLLGNPRTLLITISTLRRTLQETL
jgi:hypothetical protein